MKFPFRIYLLLNLLAISSRYRRRPPPFDVGNLLLSRFFSPILDHNIFPKKVLFFFNILINNSDKSNNNNDKTKQENYSKGPCANIFRLNSEISLNLQTHVSVHFLQLKK